MLNNDCQNMLLHFVEAYLNNIKQKYFDYFFQYWLFLFKKSIEIDNAFILLKLRKKLPSKLDQRSIIWFLLDIVQYYFIRNGILYFCLININTIKNHFQILFRGIRQNLISPMPAIKLEFKARLYCQFKNFIKNLSTLKVAQQA